MLKIFTNMKSQWKIVLLVVALLFVQAICDLSLPTYTSKLIDTGIQNNGIEYATPEKIRAEQYEKIAIFMTEKEREVWIDSYELKGEVYELKDTSKESLEEKDTYFQTPIAIYYMITQSMNENSETNQEITQSADMANMDPTQIRKQMDKTIQSMGDTMLHSAAIAFTKAENEADTVDMNLGSIQTGYLWRTGGIMLLMTLLMAVASTVLFLFQIMKWTNFQPHP